VGFWGCLVTMDETWIHRYMQRQKNNQKNEDSDFPLPKKFKKQKSSKVLASLLWDIYRILLVDYLEKDATIMVKHYIVHIVKLKQHLIPKH
jgi:hypothetical protein